jgi:hypothetical protein
MAEEAKEGRRDPFRPCEYRFKRKIQGGLPVLQMEHREALAGPFFSGRPADQNA